MKVMIIDDDPVDRYILRKTLKKEKIASEFVEASNGAEALLMLTQYGSQKKEIPELIFLDVNMPVLNGLEFLDVLEQLSREYKSRCRIAVISSHQNEGDKKKILSYESVVGYFEKPLKNEAILELKKRFRLNQAS
jgi:CheY-like chemotaxis protein